MKKIVASIIFLFIINALIITYSSFCEYVEIQTLASNMFISKNSISFIIRQNDDFLTPTVKDIIKIISNYKGVMLYSKLIDNDNYNVWGIYTNSKYVFLQDYVNEINIKDINDKNNLSIIGKNIIDYDIYNIYNKDEYVELYGKKYNIIGKIKLHLGSMLDNNIYININSLNDNVLNRYIIDGIDKNCIELAFNSLKNYYDVDVINENDNFVERYILDKSDIIILKLLIILIIITFIIILLINIIKFYEQEIKIRILLGLSSKNILFDLYKEILIFITTSNLFFIILYLFVYINMLNKYYISLYTINILYFSIALLILIYTIMFLYSKLIKKIKL